MTVIHANDPTTKVLSLLYEQRTDISVKIDETCNSSRVQRAIRGDNFILMLGHGNRHGLFSKPDKNGEYKRFLITDRHVQFLRDKTCVGIWCYANRFAENYGLHGLFSGMIISELQEAIDLNIQTTEEEVSREITQFTSRLKDCMDRYELHEIPDRMKELDDVKSELTVFNYNRLFYYA